MYNNVMNPQLHKLLLELDYRFELQTDDYFQWSEERKDALIGDIVDFFIPTINANPNMIHNIILGLDSCLRQSVEEEDYEHAEILKRTRDIFIKMIF